MTQGKSLVNSEAEDRYSALHNNANAIRAISAAVEGTIGPKGLDTMLVDSRGDVIITNDGVTILHKMHVTHPAARMLIQVAKAQQDEIGDGTTTATLLASSLIMEAVRQVENGVPIAKVIRGIRTGIHIAISSLQSRSREISSLQDPMLAKAAYVAGRENGDIADLMLQAAKQIGYEKLLDPHFKLADRVHAHDKANNEVFAGILLHKNAMNRQMPDAAREVHILVVDDALEPEALDEEALMTEKGVELYIELLNQFEQNLFKLTTLGVKLIVADRGVHQRVEEFCNDHGIMVLQRVSSKDIRLLCEHTGAKPLKRTGLKKNAEELVSYLGYCDEALQDHRLDKVRVTGGRGKQTATVLVGASTSEIVGERERIAKDAASAVQAAIRGGVVPGGGAIELAVSRDIERAREQMQGMEGFGMDVVVHALRKPLIQIVHNAGFNPLEKLEEVKGAQVKEGQDQLGVDCDSGQLLDMIEAGIVDPTLVKTYALKAAGEVAEAILRIQTVIRMKEAIEE